jgi:chloramphenicol 3-O phosphotransferase
MAIESLPLHSPTARGKIILLNGASSSGKSTLAAALQQILDEPFWHYSIDHLLVAKVLPSKRIEEGHFSWRDLRPPFFAGFHATLPVLAEEGNNLVVEHTIETAEWMDRLTRLLHAHDIYFVGLHCPLEELERRERARGDRRIGEARGDFETTHGFCSYDLEVGLAPAFPDTAYSQCSA